MIPPQIDVQSLIIFYFVASENSVTSAADKLCLTQPTLTYHLKSLESKVGVKLFDVKRQKIYLTQAGVGLFKYAKEIYQNLADAEKYLRDLKEASLRVGLAASFSHVVAKAAVKFEELYPQVKLIVKSASSLEIVEDVLSSNVDIGIVVNMEYNNSKLKTIVLSPQEKLILVASPDNPICKKANLRLEDLCNCNLVAGPVTSATRQIIIKKFEAEGFKIPPLVMVEVNTLEWGLSVVESGKGIGLYSIRTVERELSEGHLKALPLAEEIRVGVEALLRADTPIHHWAEKFVPLVKEEFNN